MAAASRGDKFLVNLKSFKTFISENKNNNFNVGKTPFSTKLSVKTYTGATGYRMNARLMHNKGVVTPHYDNNDDEKSRQVIQKHINALRTVIGANKSSRDRIVYTGLSGHGASPEHSQQDKGARFVHTFHKFTSTSHKPHVARSFSGTDELKSKYQSKYNNPKSPLWHHSYKHVAKIHVPKGSRGLETGSLSLHPGEKEYILHDGAQVKFKSKPRVDHDKETVVWTGHLVHDGVKPTSYSKK